MSTNATNNRKSNNLVSNNTNISEPNKLVQTSFNAAARAINSAKTAFNKYLELQNTLQKKQAYAALKTTMIKTQNAVIQTNNANSNLGAVVNSSQSGVKTGNPPSNQTGTMVVNPLGVPAQQPETITPVTVINPSEIKTSGGRRRRSNSKRKSSKKRQ